MKTKQTKLSNQPKYGQKLYKYILFYLVKVTDINHLSWLWLSRKANPLTALQGLLPKKMMIRRPKAELATMVNLSPKTLKVDIKILNSLQCFLVRVDPNGHLVNRLT